MQIIGDWVAQRSLDETLAAMKEARVPSGEASLQPVACLQGLSVRWFKLVPCDLQTLGTAPSVSQCLP